jgi:glutaryl-CoA dehydrogenase
MDYQCSCRVSFLLSRLARVLSLLRCSDVFIIWARCKWDGKVRGFILEKACRRFRGF